MKQVTHKTALLAKEKGFKDPCKYLYWKGELEEKNCVGDVVNKDGISDPITAPFKMDLQDWLRNNFNIHIEVVICFVKSKQVFKFKIKRVANIGAYFNFNKNYKYIYDLYEDSLENALVESLKLIE